MDVHVYLKRLKRIHEDLLDYIDNHLNNELDHNEYIRKLSIQNILESKYELKDFLYIISRIAANHYRSPNLFSKIEAILSHLKKIISSIFTNLEIFKIFEKCKKILLFLFKEKILIPDRSIFNIITDYKHTKMNYPIYFYFEFQNFFDNLPFSNDIEFFEEKRQKGENESHLCELIRDDSIDDFIIYINKNNIPLNTKINYSIFETNPLLIGKNISLIEYAAFFGSFQIFQYLRLNSVALVSTLWIYAIHGKNPEIFHLLEEDHVTLDLEMKKNCLKESIKCHHNEFTEYIQNTFFDHINEYDNLIDKIKHHNFLSLPDNLSKLSNFFFYLCKYDYFIIVKFFIENKKTIDVNKTQEKKVDDKKDGYEKLFNIYDKVQKYYREENTPLITSIKKGNKEIVELLLSHKSININKYFYSHYYIYLSGDQGDEYITPLCIAVENEHLEIVQLLLLKNNAIINSYSTYATCSVKLGGIVKEEKAPLHIAVEKQNIEILKCLLSINAININSIQEDNLSNIDYFIKNALHIAIDNRNEEIVKLLVSKNINLFTKYRHYEHVIVKDAPSYNIDVEVNSSLTHAIKYGNMKIVSLISFKLMKTLFKC